MQQELFSGAFIRQPSLAGRLFGEFAEASREFTDNPKQYLSSAFKGDGLGDRRRKALLKFGMAMGIVVYAIFFTTILVIWWYQHHKTAQVDEPETLLTHLVNADDFKQPIEMKKAKEKAGGGGGGGRNTPTPPSKGQLPVFDLHPPMIAPRPEPQLKPPSLPVMETVQVDPKLQPKRDDLAPTGLPTGVPGPPSAGPGSGGGMGSGSGGGMGSGDGTGVGPGRGYNMGGGDPRLGGGAGAGVTTAVDTKPMNLNKPRPNYTEEARKNKIQGVVIARVLVGADGLVKKVSIVRGLPDGLDEEAIRAAYQIRFRPATKNGQPVAYNVNIEIEFNLR